MSNTIEIVTKLRDQLTGPLARQAGAVGSWQGKVVGASIAVAAAAAGAARALFALADRTTQVYGQFYDLSRFTGIMSSQLHAMSIAAEQDGVSMGSLLMAFRRMPSAIDELRNGGEAAVRTFSALNMSAADFEGLSSEDAFYKIAGALVQVTDENTRAALAQDLFGRSGMTLMPFLERGEAGMRALADEARDMGMVLGEDAYEAADAFQDKLIELRAQIQGATMEAIRPMLPQLAEMTRQVMGIAVDAMPDLIAIMGAAVPVINLMADALSRVVGGIEGIAWAWGQASEGMDWLVQFVGENVFPGATVTPNGTGNTSSVSLSPSQAAGLLAPGTQIGGITGTGTAGYANGLSPFREDVSGVQAEVDAARSSIEELSSAITTLGTVAGDIGGKMDDADLLKQLNIERIQAVRDAQLEADAAMEESAARVAAKQIEAATAVKQATMQAEAEATAARQASAESAIRNAMDMGNVIGGVLAQGTRDQITFAEGMGAIGASMLDMIVNAATQAVMAYAVEAAAAAAASQAGIPVIGPFLAAAAMGSMLALVQGLLGGMPGADSGVTIAGSHHSDRVPYLLEPGERVLTREETRNYAGGSARGSTVVNLSLGSMFSSASRADLQKAGRVLREVMDAEGI